MTLAHFHVMYFGTWLFIFKNLEMCDVIIAAQYGNQVLCQYRADIQKCLDAHKYLKQGIGQKLKGNNCKKQFLVKHVLKKHQMYVFWGKT